MEKTLFFQFTLYIDKRDDKNYIFIYLFKYICSYYDKDFTIKLCYDKKNPIKLYFFIKFYNTVNYNNYDYFEFKTNLQKNISKCLQTILIQSEDTSDEEQDFYIYLKFIYPFEKINYNKYSVNYNISSI